MVSQIHQNNVMTGTQIRMMGVTIFVENNQVTIRKYQLRLLWSLWSFQLFFCQAASSWLSSTAEKIKKWLVKSNQKKGLNLSKIYQTKLAKTKWQTYLTNDKIFFTNFFLFFTTPLIFQHDLPLGQQKLKYWALNIIRDILINQQKTIPKIYGAIFNLAKMFKNKYFFKNPRFNRRLIDTLNRLSQQSQKLLQIQQKLQQLKAKNKDESEQIKTNDESESTMLSKSHHEDSFDAKDEHTKSQGSNPESIGEVCHFAVEKQQRELDCPQALQNQASTKKVSYLMKSKSMIEKQLLVQAKFIQNALSKRISLKLKLLQIEQLLVEKLQKQCENEPELWETCSQILNQLFSSFTSEPSKPQLPQQYSQVQEPKSQQMVLKENDLAPWLS